MPSELTLFFTDENGLEQQVAVNTNPFTIGRQEGNNLVIRDSGLSRRHALITSFQDVAQLSDCGSQNGTYLNGQLLASAAVLKNGDVIAIGETCKLRVQVKAQAAANAPSLAPANPPPKPVPSAPPAPSTPAAAATLELPKLSPAVLAAVATGAIIVIAGLLIGLVMWKQQKSPDKNQDIVFMPETPISNASESPKSGDPPPTTTNVPAGSDQFENSLVQVIRNISNDSNYPFPTAAVAEIKQKAQQAATPTLANTLRTISTRGDETINQIRAQGLKKPALLIFMALAETNGSGDPLAVARGLVEEVQFLRGHFGYDYADPTLLVVAAYKIPGGNKKSHPLLPTLRQLTKDPRTDRNVWFLRSKGALSDTAYDFVLRFLAYGAIAQNPRQFGLDAPPLVF
ncbi:MAG TPA: FHA domain-containing protein [Blastocatellia bacterium]|nr:FHA domain-containing protein [Blastocatellia bacterium]